MTKGEREGGRMLGRENGRKMKMREAAVRVTDNEVVSEIRIAAVKMRGRERLNVR